MKQSPDVAEVPSSEKLLELRETNRVLQEKIEELKRSNTVLTNSEKNYRKVLENAPLLIAVEENGGINFINNVGVSILGANDMDSVLGKPVLEFIHPDDHQPIIDYFQERIKKEASLSFVEYEVHFRDGRRRFLEISLLIDPSAEGLTIQYIAVDITERKRVERALAQQALLGEIELGITQPLDLQPTLDKAIDLAKISISHQSGAAIVLQDPISGKLWVPSLDIDNKLRWLIHSQISDDHGISGTIMTDGVVISAFEAKGVKNWFGKEGVRNGIQSFIGVPLVIENEILGALYIFEKRPYVFSVEDIDFLRALANRISLVITRIRLYETLLEARVSAEETAKVKTQFLANMSHELRTPLNAIVIITDLMKETGLDSIQRNYIQSISISAEKLLSTIENVLDFSKIEANKLAIEAIPYDLRDCIEEAIDLVALQANQKGLDLAYYVDPEIPQTMLGDPIRLGQIITNLLSNAVKFTETGSVYLQVNLMETNRPEDSVVKLHFEVQDTGIGIKPDKMNNLFDVFHQLDGSITRKYGGSGLGLAICKHLVNLMDGEIGVDSSGIPGRGSKFYFDIESSYVHDERDTYLQPEQPLLSEKRVLIRCSKIKSRHVLEETIKYWGMEIIELDNGGGIHADMFEQTEPDLIFLDCNIKDQDDNSILRWMEPYTNSAKWIKIVPAGTIGKTTDFSPDTLILEIPIKPKLLYDLLLEVMPADIIKNHPENHTKDGFYKNLRILLAEDDPTNQDVILLMLEKIGYRAQLAGSGVDVIGILESQEFDVIIMDLQMPEMDGLSTIHYIRNMIPEGKQPRIIALTADSRKETSEITIATGADIFLTKPIRKHKLQEILEQIENGDGLSQNDWNGDSHLSEPKTAVKVIDDSILMDLVQSLGEDSNQSVKNLISTFLTDTPFIVDQLKLSSVERSWEMLIRRAHALKGNCELFGATRLADMCKQAENLAKGEEYTRVQKLVSNIEIEYNQVVKALNEFLNNRR